MSAYNEATVIDRVAGIISRYSMFPQNARVGIAVSGGADSVCLLHALHQLRGTWNLHLTVVHINHLLRGGESDGDEQFVRELAYSLGLEIVSERINVAALANGQNLEEAARDARRSVFRREIETGRLDRIALGHTQSDQAETVLFRLLRGAYTTGLAGMRPATANGIVRPLIEIERAEIIQFLQERGLRWREDSTNQDARFARNRIRHSLLPQLTAEWNPNLPLLLARHATLAQEDEDYWEREVSNIAANWLRFANGAVILSVSSIAGLPNALIRRLIRRAILMIRGDLKQVDFRHIEAIRTLFDRQEGHDRTIIPGVDVLRSFEQVRFARPVTAPVERDFEELLDVPGTATVARCGTQFCLELIERQASTATNEDLRATLRTDLDWKRIQSVARIGGGSRTEQLVLRNWRPGDAYKRAGDQHERKLKTMFQEARVPLWERRCWPVVAVAGRIIWSRDFGPASDVAADSSSGVVLRISEKERSRS